jgi:hypothetical protein
MAGGHQGIEAGHRIGRGAPEQDPEIHAHTILNVVANRPASWWPLCCCSSGEAENGCGCLGERARRRRGPHSPVTDLARPINLPAAAAASPSCCNRRSRNNLIRLCVAVTRCHLPLTFSIPCNRNQHRPRAFFI